MDLEPSLVAACRSAAGAAALLGTERVRRRLEAHREFVAASERQGKTLSHRNRHYGFPVMTGQEEDLVLYFPLRLTPTAEGLEVEHGAEPPREYQIGRPGG